MQEVRKEREMERGREQLKKTVSPSDVCRGLQCFPYIPTLYESCYQLVQPTLPYSNTGGCALFLLVH